MGDDGEALAAEAADLVRHLIRNACVNDGTPGSGQEEAGTAILVDLLEGTGAEVQTYRPAPERTSLVAHLARRGFRPRGDLVFAAVADEEGSGTLGAGWLTTHAASDLAPDYVITESGGFPLAAPDGIRLPLVTGEKGIFWCVLTVRGTPGHASQPPRTDNALVKANEVVRHLDGLEVRASSPSGSASSPASASPRT